MLPPPPGLQLLVNGANSLSRTANRKETSNARVSARKIRLHAHHDALEFPDGKIVLLTQLSEGGRPASQAQSSHAAHFGHFGGRALERKRAVKIQLSDDEFAILTRELGEIAWNLGPSGLIFSDRQ